MQNGKNPDRLPGPGGVSTVNTWKKRLFTGQLSPSQAVVIYEEKLLNAEMRGAIFYSYFVRAKRH